MGYYSELHAQQQIDDGGMEECEFQHACEQEGLGVQEPPQNNMIFNRRQADGTFKPLRDFFDMEKS